MIDATPQFVRALELTQRPTLVMFAFSTYELAEAKAGEFAEVHPHHSPRWGSKFKAVVIPSFTRLYEQACFDYDVGPITAVRAGELGYASLWAAIKDQQPDIVGYMRRAHAKLRASYAGCTPVFFTVHAVAHDWVRNTNTRLMLSPRYWGDGEPAAQAALARKDTQLGLLIHDEVSADDLITVAPRPTLEWVMGMLGSDPQAFDGGSLGDRLAAYVAHSAVAPPPEAISFEDACRLAEVPLKAWEIVTTAYSGEYGERAPRIADGVTHEDIYLDRVGRDWFIAVRNWPANAAHKLVVLTTETVPTHLARKIATGWEVIDLDTPMIPRDVVLTKASKEVNRKSVAALVSDAQAEHFTKSGRPLEAISDTMSHVVGVKTHHSAKGSNGYMGVDVVQTMMLMHPTVYERYEALNAWTGRRDMVLSRHLDTFNQTAGRNLGFRRRGNPTHMLLINSQLWDCLQGETLARARYEMRELVTQRVQKAAQRRANTASQQLTPSQEKLSRIREALQRKHAH